MSICFAFNQQGQRCDRDADGHEMHGRTIEWTDDECWVPGGVGSELVAVPVIDLPMRVDVPIAKQVEEGPVRLAPVPAPPKPKAPTKGADDFEAETDGETCMVCNHPWHEETCDRKIGRAKVDCGCLTAVS